MEYKEKRIGLLGGSFNPAHSGHLYISERALELLEVDEVWWLVSPQNPLKSHKETEEYESRIKKALKITKNNKKIIISDFELTNKLTYTIDTLNSLINAYKHYKFIWLMGADNLIQMHKWKNWEEIFTIIPIAVFNRENACSANQALQSIAGTKFHNNLIEKHQINKLTSLEPPKWCFLDIPSNPESSTNIRENYRK